MNLPDEHELLAVLEQAEALGRRIYAAGDWKIEDTVRQLKKVKRTIQQRIAHYERQQKSA